MSNKILIVDDDLTTTMLIKKVLEENCYKVIEAHSLEEMILIMEQEWPILVLIEYSLKNCTAEECINKIKIKFNKVPNFIVQTGVRDEEIAIKMMKIGALDYIVKDDNLLICLPKIISTTLSTIEIKKSLVKAEHEIIKAKQKAELAEKAKLEFIANISHEIRTPLTSVIGFSELIAEKISDNNIKKYVDLINTAGKNLLLIVNDLLYMSELESDMLKIKPQKVNIIDIFNGIESIFHTSLENKVVKFNLIIDEKFPKYIEIDESLTRQLLFNIVGNSIKFTDKGHVNCSIYFEDKNEIEKRANLIIDIEDTGSGIDKSDLENIFKPFKQGNGRSELSSGTGLGLTICKKITKLMGGDIKVISELGKGSIFTIKIKNVKFFN